jgi:hypothetical protein
MPCDKAYQREWRVQNPERHARSVRQRALRTKFGIDIAAYDRLMELQRGVCAVCEQTCSTGKRLAVDHDHVTGKVRGLLCRRCNAALGMFGDVPEMVEKAALYLRQSLN